MSTGTDASRKAEEFSDSIERKTDRLGDRAEDFFDDTKDKAGEYMDKVNARSISTTILTPYQLTGHEKSTPEKIKDAVKEC